MSRIVAPPLGLTLSDIRAVLRWFRSRQGALGGELQNGTIALVNNGVPSFRRLLAILDGPDSGLKLLEIDEPWEREIKALFSAYRRLRRAERRLSEEICDD